MTVSGLGTRPGRHSQTAAPSLVSEQNVPGPQGKGLQGPSTGGQGPGGGTSVVVVGGFLNKLEMNFVCAFTLSEANLCSLVNIFGLLVVVEVGKVTGKKLFIVSSDSSEDSSDDSSEDSSSGSSGVT